MHRTLRWSTRGPSLILLLSMLAALLVVAAEPAHATHFRFRDLSWERLDGRTVELTMRIADRRSFYGSIGVGSSFSAAVSTGDGASENLQGQVISVNEVDDWFIAEVRGAHTYTGDGPFTVQWESCCTLSTLRNSPDSSLRTRTVVDLRDGNSGSPFSLVSPIVNVPAGTLTSFRIPARDADGDNLTFRLATTSEAIVSQPPGLAIDQRTGVVTWDTTGRQEGLWIATVVIADEGGASTQNSFLIRVSATVTEPPLWVTPPTPADRTEFDVDPGESTTFHLRAQDPDGDPVAITPLSQPAGLDCSISAAGSDRTLSCSFTPPQPGTALVAFDAQDFNGASAGIRTYRLTSGRYVALGDSYASGEGVSPYEDGTDLADVNECRRSDHAYSQLVRSSTLAPSSLSFHACSGARTWHMYESQWADQPRQLQPSNLGDDVLLVTMSIGGNDVGFADIIRDCADGWELLPFNNCVSDPEKTEEPFQQALDRLKGQAPEGDTSKTRPLSEVYRDLRLRASRARVVIVGYPQFFKTSGTVLFRCSGVKKADQKWANEKAAELNETIRRFAEAHGFDFVDTTPYFEGHRLCELGGGEDREWFYDIQFFDINASFHPDRDGHRALADAVLDRLAAPDPATQFVLMQGETRRFEVEVPAGRSQIGFGTTWPGSDVVLTATSPTGRTITRGSLGGDIEHLLGPTFEILRVNEPEAGTWTVEVFGADLGADGEPVRFLTYQHDPQNVRPVASIDMEKDGTTIHLDGTASVDPDGQIVEYRWEISNDTEVVAELTGEQVSYTFDQPGTFDVALEVVDDRGDRGFAGVGAFATASFTVGGPFEPVQPSPVWNDTQAGRAVPLRWSVHDLDGAPVDDPDSFVGITSRPVNCEASGGAQEVPESATTTSGLLYNGHGVWHMNWKTSSAWSGTCRIVTVSLSDGSTVEARFRFR